MPGTGIPDCIAPFPLPVELWPRQQAICLLSYMESGGQWKVAQFTPKGEKQATPVIQPFLRHKSK